MSTTLILGLDNEGEFTPIKVDNNGHLTTISTIEGSISVSNFPTVQTVSGAVAVSNFPTVQTVSGTVNIGTLPTINITNTAFDSKLRDGHNNIITSTSYGIDGVRGLDVSIKNATQAEPLNVAIDTTNTLTCAINNYPATYEMSANGYLSSNTGALNTNLRKADGSEIGVSGAPLVVSNTNNITDYATETTLNGIKTQADKLKFNGDNLKTEITNSSLVVETGLSALDVNITGGTITNANGKAYLYSGNEATAITATTISTKNGIDANIINTVAINGSVSLTDGTDTAEIVPTITANLASNKGLVCDSVLYGYNNATGFVQNITMTYDGVNKNQLDVSDATAILHLEAITDRANSTNTLLAGGNLVNATTRDNTATTNNKLDTTNSKIDTTNTTLSAVNGKLTTTTYNSTTGLNVYSISPKTISYIWSGYQSTASANNFIFGGNSAITSFNIGINYLRNFFIYHNGTGTKYIDIDYINSSGYLTSVTEQAITTSTSTVILSNIINIIKIVWSPTASNINNTATTFICRDSVDTLINRNSYSLQMNQPIFTVPYGYTGVIKNIQIYIANGGDMRFFVRDIYNNTKQLKYLANASNSMAAVATYSAGMFPNANYLFDIPLDGGDSCFMQSVNASAGNTIFNGVIEITKI